VSLYADCSNRRAAETIDGMSDVIQMERSLVEAPRIGESHDFTLRNFQQREDIGHWLRIRHAAFAREKLGVRQWDAADFRREISAKSWWNPERMWFAEPVIHAHESPSPIGSVTCALRGSGADAKPVVHWLAVHPGWRRRGVARLLMSALEAHCWANGHRTVYLETHADWTAAVAFYETLGYGVATRS